MDKSWFEKFRRSSEYEALKKKPIAYFCVEYALSELLPTYAGGLGVLAGDYMKELCDQKIPSVAVGLYYESKYGVSDPKKAVSLPPEEQGLVPVIDDNNRKVIVKVPFPERDVYAAAWKWEKDTIPVLLLDTNIEENNSEDRALCYKLYDSNRETRLKQEMLLGIGGFRLLEALGIHPSIFHMNEGHSSLLDLEILRHEMEKRKIGFKEAMGQFNHHVVFTNHTLLAAGNEIYSNDLFTYMLERYASELEIPVAQIASMGEIKDSNSFSMSLFAFKLAGKINAVSRLHAKEAKKSWADYDFDWVTNGIHLPTWDCIHNSSIADEHRKNKSELLKVIEKRTGKKWGEDELLLGWARRMVRYKRPLSLFGEIKKLREIVKNSRYPVRIVMAGISHQADMEGAEIIRQIKEIVTKELPDNVVYLPDYSITLSKLLVSGCDVWLNTPVVGSEACGTSGMKACLNGVLQMTTRDGWVDEADMSEAGWILDNDTIHDSIIDTIRDSVVPMYYKDKKEWERRMKKARELVKDDFSATRMLREYFEKLYLPILTSSYSHYFS